MRKRILLLSLLGFAAGIIPLTNAQDGVPQRGKTYTKDSDVSRFSPKPGASTTEIYILRGTEPKEQGSVTVAPPAPEPAAKTEEAPKVRNHRRKGRG